MRAPQVRHFARKNSISCETVNSRYVRRLQHSTIRKHTHVQTS